MEFDHIYKNLGQRIRDLRNGQGQTQEQLAKAIGISRASLANIEAGRQKVLVHHLFELAEALDLESPSDLLLIGKGKNTRSTDASPLPLSDEGLTDKQRQEILNLMGNVLNNNTNENNGSEER